MVLNFRKTEVDEVVIALIFFLACLSQDNRMRVKVRNWDEFCTNRLGKDAISREAERIWHGIYQHYLEEGAAFIMRVAEDLFRAGGTIAAVGLAVLTLLSGPLGIAAGKYVCTTLLITER